MYLSLPSSEVHNDEVVFAAVGAWLQSSKNGKSTICLLLFAIFLIK